MAEEKEMSFLEHLEEFRWHIVRSLVVVLVLTILAFIFIDEIFAVLNAPRKIDFPAFKWMCKLGELTGATESLCVKSINFTLQSRNMTGQFTMAITMAFFSGIIIAFPYVFWEIWRFISPGLLKKERQVTSLAVISVSFLFMLGVLFGYFILCPISIYFLGNYHIGDPSLIVNQFDITSYISTVVTLILGSGIIFQLPNLVYVLTKIGIVTPSFLRSYRKHAVVFILIISAILTPPDPFSQIIVSLPLWMLYEISILVSAVVMRSKRRKEKLAGQDI